MPLCVAARRTCTSSRGEEGGRRWAGVALEGHTRSVGRVRRAWRHSRKARGLRRRVLRRDVLRPVLRRHVLWLSVARERDRRLLR